jgi:histidyl-tRNA synthetase
MSDTTKPARGMRDFLPDDVRRRAYVIGVVAEVYERYGFEPLETPAVENIETLLGKYGEEGNRLIFKILKRGEHERTGEADLALRYDLTVPLARVVAEHRGTLPRFFKRYQIQPVWRADRPARGRFREFYQCDVDAIGSTSPVVEAEVCAAVSEALERLGFDDFVVRLNHRDVLRALLDGAGVPAALHDTALVALDKLDKIGGEGVLAELESRGIAGDTARAVLAAFAPPSDSSNAYWFQQLEARTRGHGAGEAGLELLRAIVTLSAGTPAGPRLRLDPSLARGLSYYTGAIFEVAVPDLAGSLGGGGRYDALVGMFSGGDVPACGFSLGLERILVVMAERGMFPASVQAAGADVLATIWNAQTAADTLALAGALRAGGLRVEVYPEVDRLGKQVKYAASRGIPFAVIVGDDERAAGTVTVKDLRTGAQAPVPRTDAPGWIRARLQAPGGAV